MFVGKQVGGKSDPGGLTCHSLCRFQGGKASNGADDDNWFLHAGLSYTLLTFPMTIRSISGATSKWLPGWWKVGTEFYFVKDDGHASRRPTNLRKPAKSYSAGLELAITLRPVIRSCLFGVNLSKVQVSNGPLQPTPKKLN